MGDIGHWYQLRHRSSYQLTVYLVGPHSVKPFPSKMSWINGRTIHQLIAQNAMKLIRRQKVLEEAQKQADEVVDRENTLAFSNLSKRETKKEVLKEGVLPTLFGEPEQGEIDEDSPKGVVEELGMENLLFNILDRNRGQVIEDQQADVTLDKARSKTL